MNVFKVLLDTYDRAETSGMVDQVDGVEEIGAEPVLLPLYHWDRRTANDNRAIEVTLDSEGNFIKAEDLAEETRIIFPVTEKSVYRTSKAEPHALVDELSYLTDAFNEKRYALYREGLDDWYHYDREHTGSSLLASIYQYMTKETLLDDILAYMYPGYQVTFRKDDLRLTKDKERQLLSRKCFVTFRVERATEKDLTVTSDTSLRQSYINYVEASINQKLKKGQAELRPCTLTGEMAYCVDRHPGVLGSASIISRSDANKEVFQGRFEKNALFTSMSLKASQKIHLMLRYLNSHPRTVQSLGQTMRLIVWNDGELETSAVEDFGPMVHGKGSGGGLFDEIMEESFDDQGFLIGDVSSRLLLNQLSGYFEGNLEDLLDQEYYVLILVKTTNGRVAVDYFRKINYSSLADHLIRWQDGTNWYVHRKDGGFVKKPFFSEFVRYAYGEYDKKNKKMVVKSNALYYRSFQDLIPCIIDGQDLPLHFYYRMRNNVMRRRRYGEHWSSFLTLACSVFRKYRMDYHDERMSIYLNENKQTRSYLYGRLAAVYELLEREGVSQKNKYKHITHVEKLWEQLMRYPEKTLLVLVNKIMPYQMRLKKDDKKAGLYRLYQKNIDDIMGRLNVLREEKVETNHPVNEDFIFGYYAQRLDIFTSGKNKEENLEEDDDTFKE